MVVTILQLPDELLLSILQYLSKSELLLTAPLVCKSFSQLLRLPSCCWTHTRFQKILGKSNCSMAGAAFCKWLQPRAVQLQSFLFPVHACLLRENSCFTSDLLAVLPSCLTTLQLHSNSQDSDECYAANQLQGLQSFSKLETLQDLALHLPALSRFSNLRLLSAPMYAQPDSAAYEALVSLTSLQNLQLEWRDLCSKFVGYISHPDRRLPD